MPAGRHGHKMREYKRRIDALVAEERERRRPPPPPISPKHAAMRDRIERAMREALELVPEGMDLDKALATNDTLANAGAHIVVLIREEQEFLIGQGVDPRPYDRFEPRV